MSYNEKELEGLNKLKVPRKKLNWKTAIIDDDLNLATWNNIYKNDVTTKCTIGPQV